MPVPYSRLTAQQAEDEVKELYDRYEAFKSRGVKLDMSRGKPSPKQLDLAGNLYETLSAGFTAAAGADTRNYGELAGISEMKEIFSAMLGVPADGIIVGGASSLNLMYDTISRAVTHGLPGSAKPWKDYDKIRFLCPSPGYDRHFAVTEHFGFELVSVPMTEHGPDMDAVAWHAASDERVKGIWCVPVYSNPTGAIYSDEVIAQLANMKCAASDFTIMWDNAYGVHHLYGHAPQQANILDLCTDAGHPERVIEFCSTSKITYAGAGVSCLAGSPGTVKAALASMKYQTIGYDKINMLAHARFLGSMDNLRAHMEKHAAILRPRFETVDRVLTEELGGLNIASWTKPLGGYFINLVIQKNKASRVIRMCADANVTLTGAGAAFPYGKDPDDSNIRIAPSYPELEELETATRLLSVCVKLASLEKQLA